MPALTCDHFFNGKVVLHQPQSGYRFSVDAIILAHLIRPGCDETMVDLGTGCGVIPILLAYRHAHLHICGVEIQSSLADLARRNVAENQMADRVRIVEKDMATLTPGDVGGPVDRVVANPPYRQLASGRINVDHQKAVARHELAIDLARLLSTARRMLKKSGRVHLIYPSVRSVDLLAAMRGSGLEPKCLTMIHSRAESPARLIGVEGVKDGRPGGLDVTPPLAIYQADGSYTPALAAMFTA